MTPDELNLKGKTVAYTDLIPGVPEHYVVVFTDQTVLSFPKDDDEVPCVVQGTGEKRPVNE